MKKLRQLQNSTGWMLADTPHSLLLPTDPRGTETNVVSVCRSNISTPVLSPPILAGSYFPEGSRGGTMINCPDLSATHRSWRSPLRNRSTIAPGAARAAASAAEPASRRALDAGGEPFARRCVMPKRMVPYTRQQAQEAARGATAGNADVPYGPTLFSASERSADRRLSFPTLVVPQSSAVASLVRTRFQRVYPDCDIWDEPSGRVDELFFGVPYAR